MSLLFKNLMILMNFNQFNDSDESMRITLKTKEGGTDKRQKKQKIQKIKKIKKNRSPPPLTQQGVTPPTVCDLIGRREGSAGRCSQTHYKSDIYQIECRQTHYKNNI